MAGGGLEGVKRREFLRAEIPKSPTDDMVIAGAKVVERNIINNLRASVFA